ncbi:hypothetical protein [uncultured Rhodoblastus sp.]|uniref:hypothetical protein n=1 Tax=uncultured Rhodoblastus sp. TaxID=543037 RepID=UPI0025CCEDFB|nr:hypothetical protein [uncultured Rhodoblastus sp.]
MNTKKHEWIKKLAAGSAAIADMKLASDIPDAALDADAFSLANCDAHCRLIARAIGDLLKSNSTSKSNARNLIRRLISRDTYGAFAELAAYDWLAQCPLKFTTEVAMTSSDVLATEGSTLDGRIEFGSMYFDIKAFGSNGRLAQRLKERLEKEIPDEQVLIEESWDLSFDIFSDLIETAPDIANELRQKGMVRKGPMVIRLDSVKPVTIIGRNVEPYRLAKANVHYPFRDAKQFTRNNPFILILVVHPWFNYLSIYNDFAGIDTAFTRSLARRAFMQFSHDSTPLTSIAKKVPADVTIGDASRLLSAIFFVNVWPKDADSSIKYAMPSWLYLNPRATHRLTYWHAKFFCAQNPNGTQIDGFADDDY